MKRGRKPVTGVNRTVVLSVRMTPAEIKRLDAHRNRGESRSDAARRLLGARP